MTIEDRIKQLEDSSKKRFEEAAENYPDIKILWEDYHKLVGQATWTTEFLDGYLSCISDLIMIKKLV